MKKQESAGKKMHSYRSDKIKFEPTAAQAANNIISGATVRRLK